MNAAAREPVFLDTARAYADTHAYLRELRERDSVTINELGIFGVLRGRYLDLVLNDENTRQFELEGMYLRGIHSGPLFDFFRDAMLFANGDVHRKRRLPMSRTFAFPLMDGMRPEIRRIAAELVEAHRGKGPFDFINEFTRVVPARIIATIIGAPPEDWPQFTQWVSAAARGIGVFTPDELPEIDAGVEKLGAYVERLFAARRREPKEDFLTAYLKSTSAGDLTESEIRTQMAGVILAGSDTTKTGIASVLSQLLQHPEQWALLCGDPDRWKKQAVEEGLRFDPPVASIPRFTKRDLEIDGVVIPEGRVVSMSIVSALRDPETFARPDEFDIRRTDFPRWNVAFGAGAHRCLGEALARAEMEETIATIARLAPGVRLIGEPPKITGHMAIRHIDRMTIDFG